MANATVKDPDGLIWMHHPKTGGVKSIRRRSLAVWAKQGWVEGSGGAQGIPANPDTLGVRTQLTEEQKEVAAKKVKDAAAATETPADAERTDGTADTTDTTTPETNTPASTSTTKATKPEPGKTTASSK